MKSEKPKVTICPTRYAAGYDNLDGFFDGETVGVSAQIETEEEYYDRMKGSKKDGK